MRNPVGAAKITSNIFGNAFGTGFIRTTVGMKLRTAG